MFCEHQTFANFAMVDQFATLKSAKPKLLLVNTHDPCQNAIVRSQRVKFSADLAHSQRFFTSKNSSNTVHRILHFTFYSPLKGLSNDVLNQQVLSDLNVPFSKKKHAWAIIALLIFPEWACFD